MQRTDYREDLPESYCSHQLAAGRKGMAHNSSLECSFTHHIQKHKRLASKEGDQNRNLETTNNGWKNWVDSLT